ncbi:hypothetical protein Bca4012_037253 [Brassica carinata]
MDYLRIKKEHVDSHKLSTTTDVPGLPKSKQANLNGGGRASKLYGGNQLRLHLHRRKKLKDREFEKHRRGDAETNPNPIRIVEACLCIKQDQTGQARKEPNLNGEETQT